MFAGKKDDKELSNDSVQVILDSLRASNIDVSSYTQEIFRSNLYEQIQKMVENFFCQNDLNSNEHLQKEFISFLEDKNNKDEDIISIYLASLSLMSFMHHVESRYDKKDLLIDVYDYLGYVFFLKECIEKSTDNVFKDLIHGNESLFEFDDFFTLLEARSYEIFRNGLNGNTSAIFALKDLIETDLTSSIGINWGEKPEDSKSIHCKGLALEKLYYQNQA